MELIVDRNAHKLVHYKRDESGRQNLWKCQH